MKTNTQKRGYTLVEVLIAAALLAVAVGAAATLAGTMVAQEEINARLTRAYNLQEQAARLYQLGLAPGTITALLPQESNVTLSFTTNTLTVADVGDVERADCSMVFTATTTRTNAIVVVRPTIR